MIRSLHHFGKNAENENKSKESIEELKKNNNQEQEESNILDCMDYMGAFKLKKNFFDSEVEKKVYDVLRSFINKEYIIVPHIAFREIFIWKWEMDWDLTDKVTKMHFDFGIYNEEYKLIMIVEIWGKDHYNEANVKANDKFKDELLKEHNIKLIILDMSQEMNNDELSKTVIKKIKDEIPSRQDYPAYCPKCHSIMKLKRNGNTGDLFYSCSRYRKGQESGCRGYDIETVPPLYRNIKNINKK